VFADFQIALSDVPAPNPVRPSLPGSSISAYAVTETTPRSTQLDESTADEHRLRHLRLGCGCSEVVVSEVTSPLPPPTEIGNYLINTTNDRHSQRHGTHQGYSDPLPTSTTWWPNSLDILANFIGHIQPHFMYLQTGARGFVE
jgi:hypothetical protein